MEEAELGVTGEKEAVAPWSLFWRRKSWPSSDLLERYRGEFGRSVVL
jgi:hypothetical protein